VIRPFTYEALPMRVVFGAGSLAKLPDEVEALGLTRVLVLCSPEQEDTGKQVADALGDRAAGVLPEARMHVPIEVAHRAGSSPLSSARARAACRGRQPADGGRGQRRSPGPAALDR
jgi:hypothetical protein